MKLLIKNLIPVALGLLLLTSGSFASPSKDLFAQVPQGDSTYAELRQLEDTGLLAPGDSNGPLTRFEVAQRIWKAGQKYKDIVLAQADSDIPPPPENDLPVSSSSAPADNNAVSPNPAPAKTATGEPAPAASASSGNDQQKLAEAEKNLKSLQEAYDFELQVVKEHKSSLTDEITKVETAEYDLWRSVKGITEYPSVSMHGIARAFGISQQYYGNSGLNFAEPASRFGYAYLDLRPTGAVSKELHWDAIFRFYSNNMTPTVGNDGIITRRLSAEVSPDFMTATIGDFYQAYTPFTLWNRNNLDLFYKPEMIARQDDIYKYEEFFNQEPAWPFRGLRIGTAIGWADSDILQDFKVSAFTHMIRNGFADPKGWFLGPSDYTDWIIAGNGELNLKKWYAGNTSWQLTTNAYGVVLTEPLNTNTPGSPYDPYNPTTWAHQYVIESIQPTLKIGFGDDFYAGLKYEGSYSSYQDDERDNNKVITDYAMNMGGFLQAGNSKISFSYINVGPNYFSPLAQTRQDNLTSSNFLIYTPSPWLYLPTAPGQFFLTSVPRAGGIFRYYDRTQDNTFPYGLATPNRQGIGADLDIEALKKKALKIKGAAYFVQEISGNLVVNSAGTGFAGLDPGPTGAVPVRNFTYINMGPSFDLGPSLGLETPLEIGTNVRYEQTTSVIGTLTSSWILGGLKVGLFPWWEVTGAFSYQTMNGSDEGIGGLPIARYSYLFDNTDLGKYAIFNVNGTTQSLQLSTTFKINRNSSFYFDYDLTQGTEIIYLPLNGTLKNQYMEITYALEF